MSSTKSEPTQTDATSPTNQPTDQPITHIGATADCPHRVDQDCNCNPFTGNRNRITVEDVYWLIRNGIASHAWLRWPIGIAGYTLRGGYLLATSRIGTLALWATLLAHLV